MNRFRSGRFERETLARPFRALCPAEALPHLTDIDLDDLARRGKRLVLLDVDNTLVRWRAEAVADETRAWIDAGHRIGIRFCIVSNSRRRSRLQRIADDLGIDMVLGRMKPSRAMFRTALDQFGVEPGEAVMVGDQLLTDVLGANRAGIDAILVQPLHPRELFATKANRLAESFLRRWIDRALIDDDAPPVVLGHVRLARQFVKFCIVGATCFLIDAGLHRYLMFNAAVDGRPLSEVVGVWVLGLLGHDQVYAHRHAFDAAFGVLKVPTAALAILNSFVFNRLWTFGIRGSHQRMIQFSKFVVVALVGLGLNTLISTGINRLAGSSDSTSWTLGTIIAAGIVAIWNFSGQRLWAFRGGQSG